MAKGREWTDDEVKAEIAAAVRIVAEDRERAEYTRLHEKYKPDPDTDPAGNGKTPPPKKDGDDGEPPKPKRGLWWGVSDE